MKSFIFSFALFLCALSVCAQINNVEQYRNNAVFIQSGDESGSGFICAKTLDSAFVVSAYHVVRHSNHLIQTTLSDGRIVTTRVLFKDILHDLVVLGMKVPDFNWIPLTIATDVEVGERVFFITMLEPDKPLLPKVAVATIDKWDVENGIQYVSLRGVTGGDSGSALLCDHGIAGVIQTQQVKSLDIVTARNLIQRWNKSKWQLIDTP